MKTVQAIVGESFTGVMHIACTCIQIEFHYTLTHICVTSIDLSHLNCNILSDKWMTLI